MAKRERIAVSKEVADEIHEAAERVRRERERKRDQEYVDACEATEWERVGLVPPSIPSYLRERFACDHPEG